MIDEAKAYEAFLELLCDGDTGISEHVYWLFYELFGEANRRELDKIVDATDGYFYVA